MSFNQRDQAVGDATVLVMWNRTYPQSRNHLPMVCLREYAYPRDRDLIYWKQRMRQLYEAVRSVYDAYPE